MTDEEVICEWMEPKPEFPMYSTLSVGGWWIGNEQARDPHEVDSLDRLHDVEARLTDEQWSRYATLVIDTWIEGHTDGLSLIQTALHATAAQKIAALAAVIRADAKASG